MDSLDNQTQKYINSRNKVIENTFNRSNKIYNKIEELQKNGIEFDNNLTLYFSTIENIKDKIKQFEENDTGLSKNVYVDLKSIQESDYIGCYKQNGTMEYTGEMDFVRCRQNAFDLKKPFFSVTKENDKNICYVGDDLGNIINQGQGIKENTLSYRKIKNNNNNFTPPYKLVILNTTFAIIDSNDLISISNNKDKATEELKDFRDGNTENTKKSKFEVTNDGKFRLLNANNNNVRWTSYYKNFESMVVNDWLPYANDTNPYNRSYLETYETLNNGDSIFSQNGKYKFSMNDNNFKLSGAQTSCVDTMFGNTENIALHHLKNSKYEIKENTASNSNAINVFSDKTLGECLVECDNNVDCNAIEYSNEEPSICNLLNDIGATSENFSKILALKSKKNPFADADKLGKFGYIDENNILNEYPEEMIEYNYEYNLFNETKSNGNIIKTVTGDETVGINECNLLSNCGGLNYNKNSNLSSLIDNSIFPKSNKQFDKESQLYVRKQDIVNHNSCSKTVETIQPDLWNNYEILNKVTMINRETHKCGLINYIDSDIRELQFLFNKLQNGYEIIGKTIENLVDLDVELKKEVLKIQKHVNDSMSTIILTRDKYTKLDDKFIKEGFNNKQNTNYIDFDNNTSLILKTISYSLLGLLSYSLYKKYFKK